MTNIQQTLLKIIVLSLFLPCSSLAAKEISGVTIPEKATLSDDTTVQLNGAGIRSKFFFDIYIGALYVETTSTFADILTSSNGANRMLMHFLYDGVAKKKITAGWTDGFEENNSPEQFEKLKAALDQFNALFTDTKKGDVILLDYIPQTGTQVSINNQLKGTIPGAEFNKALRKVWLGEEPADSGLKKALLGGK